MFIGNKCNEDLDILPERHKSLQMPLAPLPITKKLSSTAKKAHLMMSDEVRIGYGVPILGNFNNFLDYWLFLEREWVNISSFFFHLITFWKVFYFYKDSFRNRQIRLNIKEGGKFKTCKTSKNFQLWKKLHSILSENNLSFVDVQNYCLYKGQKLK